MTDGKQSLEGVLPIPWEQNPLIVFGLTPEMVRGLQDRPEALPSVVRIMKKAQMLAKHPDHTRDEQDAMALNEAQAYIENPYWQRTIIKQYLQLSGSLGPQHKELGQLRGKLNELAQELVRLKRKDELREADSSAKIKPIWYLSQMPLQKAQVIESFQVLPHCLPALLVLDANKGSTTLYLVDEQRCLCAAEQPSKWTHSLPESVRSLCMKLLRTMAPNDDDSQIRSIRAGLRVAAQTVKQTFDQLRASQSMAGIHKLRRQRWWPDLSKKPKTISSEADWRRWGEFYGQELISKSLMANKAFIDGAKYSDVSLQAAEQELMQKLQSEEARYRVENAGLRLLFSDEQRNKSQEQLFRAFHQGGCMRFVLGSTTGMLPTGAELEAAARHGVSVGEIPLLFPLLCPTLTKDWQLVTTSSPERQPMGSNQLPYVKLEVPGRILFSISLEQVFLEAEMRMLPV